MLDLRPRTGTPGEGGGRREEVPPSGGPGGGVQARGDAARAGVHGGESLLAAVEEGGGVGALLAAVVVVGLPALLLLLPLAAQDADEGLRGGKHTGERWVGVWGRGMWLWGQSGLAGNREVASYPQLLLAECRGVPERNT